MDRPHGDRPGGQHGGADQHELDGPGEVGRHICRFRERDRGSVFTGTSTFSSFLCLGGLCKNAWPTASSTITGGTCAVGSYVASISTAGVPTCSVPAAASSTITGGTCAVGSYVTAISTAGVPTCTVPTSPIVAANVPYYQTTTVAANRCKWGILITPNFSSASGGSITYVYLLINGVIVQQLAATGFPGDQNIVVTTSSTYLDTNVGSQRVISTNSSSNSGTYNVMCVN